MTKVLKVASARKPNHTRAKATRTERKGVGLEIKIPLYVAATALLAVYVWGAVESLPMFVALGLSGAWAASELLKPKLGELVAEAMEAKDTLATRLLLLASAACVALGAFGGVIALQAANGPREVFDAQRNERDRAQARVAAAEGTLALSRHSLDAVPTCTPEMPRIRCIEQDARNAPVRAQRQQAVNEAQADLSERRAELRREQEDLNLLPDPGPGVPHVSVWAKAGVVGGIEFVLFVVPFAARRRLTVKADAKADAEGAVKKARKELTAADAVVKVNTGGWEKRRLRYGPSGRKPRLRVIAGHQAS